MTKNGGILNPEEDMPLRPIRLMRKSFRVILLTPTSLDYEKAIAWTVRVSSKVPLMFSFRCIKLSGLFARVSSHRSVNRDQCFQSSTNDQDQDRRTN